LCEGKDYRFHVVEGLPADYRVVGADYDVYRRCFVLQVESAEFAPVEDGAMLPFFGDIVFIAN
jgi:hypothetical protein